MSQTWKRHCAAAAVVMACGISVPTFAQPGAPEAVRQAIRDYITQWQNRFNEHDAKSLATMYTSNAIRVLPNGQIEVGPSEIEKGLSGDVKTFSNVSLKTEDVKAQGDIAWGYVHWTIMGKDANGKPIQLKGNSTNTWIREGGIWKIVQEGAVYQAFPNPAEAPSQ